jgi:MFS family permease
MNVLGSSAGIINTAAYSYVSQAYPDKVEKMASVMEGISGLGCTIAPILATLLKNQLGFEATFYIFGLTMLPCIMLMCCLPDPKKIR